MVIRTVYSLLILALMLAAEIAKADTMENLVFTATATCESGFKFQECTPGSVGPLTGTYTLDVTTQTIVGPWSFTSPFFASLSSGDTGAIATVFQGVMNGGVSYNIPEFSEQTPTFTEALSFGFTGSETLTELGAISTPVPVQVVVSGLCQSVPGSSPAGCEPDVNIAGTTTLASTPEPATNSLMILGIGLGVIIMKRKLI